MKQEQRTLDRIFESLNDLKSVFKLGEKVVPIIKSLTEFMHEIIPLIENINASISHSSAQMPKVTNQINNVTNATELATTEILDLVDEISGKLTELGDSLTTLHEREKIRDEIFKKLVPLVNGHSDISALLKDYDKISDDEDLYEKLKLLVSNVNDDTQVQDITAQQLSAVNHLIGSVHQKLQNLVEDIDESDLKSEFSGLRIEVPKEAHYDPNANYDPHSNKQVEVDNIISDQQRRTSQEEIDKLFSRD